jgi:hypothetical protein
MGKSGVGPVLKPLEAVKEGKRVVMYGWMDGCMGGCIHPSLGHHREANTRAGGEKKGGGTKDDEEEDVRASERASDGSASNADHGARDAASERCDTTAVRALTTTGSL